MEKKEKISLRQSKHTTVKLDAKDLAFNPRNPRKFSSQRLQMLSEAMIRFGDLGGVVENIRTGHLVGGHARCSVFQKEKNSCDIKIDRTYDIPSAQGTVAEGRIAYRDIEFSYRQVSWPESIEKAANIAANKGAGTWDVPLLKEAINDLDALNFDLNLTLWSQDELDDLFGGKPIDDEADDGPTSQEVAYKVAVTCADAEQQARVIEWCQAEKIECKPVMS